MKTLVLSIGIWICSGLCQAQTWPGYSTKPQDLSYTSYSVQAPTVLVIRTETDPWEQLNMVLLQRTLLRESYEWQLRLLETAAQHTSTPVTPSVSPVTIPSVSPVESWQQTLVRVCPSCPRPTGR